MTKIEIELPEELAHRARRAGLLSEGAIERLLEEAMRRQAGRALVDVARRTQKASIPPLSTGQIDTDMKSVPADGLCGCFGTYRLPRSPPPVRNPPSWNSCR
jgi:hypothetical protein